MTRRCGGCQSCSTGPRALRTRAGCGRSFARHSRASLAVTCLFGRQHCALYHAPASARLCLPALSLRRPASACAGLCFWRRRAQGMMKGFLGMNAACRRSTSSCPRSIPSSRPQLDLRTKFFIRTSMRRRARCALTSLTRPGSPFSIFPTSFKLVNAFAP